VARAVAMYLLRTHESGREALVVMVQGVDHAHVISAS
jgi:hypothetical protein